MLGNEQWKRQLFGAFFLHRNWHCTVRDDVGILHRTEWSEVLYLRQCWQIRVSVCRSVCDAVAIRVNFRGFWPISPIFFCEFWASKYRPNFLIGQSTDNFCWKQNLKFLWLFFLNLNPIARIKIRYLEARAPVFSAFFCLRLSNFFFVVSL